MRIIGGKGIGASEGDLRIPGIIRWPGGGVKAKSEISAPTSLLDMLPTVADIVQEKLDPNIKVNSLTKLTVLAF